MPLFSCVIVCNLQREISQLVPLEFSVMYRYTHGNLAELYLYTLSDVKNGFLHFYTSCKVGCDFFGPKHPNVRAKLVEFATFTEQIGIVQLSQRILNGDNGFAECEDLLQDLLTGLRSTASVSVEEWVKSEEWVDVD